MTPEIIFVKTMSVNDLFIKKGYDSEIEKIRDNIYRYAKRTDKLFHMRRTYDGLRVERIK
tara:strand:- start:476 stop:655 length:180 start_codon:yes stop_codon:yes gene_type:complete